MLIRNPYDVQKVFGKEGEKSTQIARNKNQTNLWSTYLFGANVKAIAMHAAGFGRNI